MNDVIHEIISMSNDETIYDQYKNSEIKDNTNNEISDIQNDKKQNNILSTKNESDTSRITNENSMSNITVNTEIDSNKDSDNDKPIDVADINVNKEKLKSVNKRLLNKQMYNNKILDAITPISYNINNKLGQEVMTCDASSDISPVNAQSLNKLKSFKFTKTNVIIIISMVLCVVFIFAIVYITRRNKTTKFDIISNTNIDSEHNDERDTHDSPDYDKDYKQFGTKINSSINGGKNISKHFKTLPKRDNKGRFIKSQ